MTMKVAERFIDYVYFSGNIKSYYPKIYNELTEILSKNKVSYGVLHWNSRLLV